MRRFLCPGARDDDRGKAACQLRVEHGSRDPDALLPPGLPDLVEPGAVQEFTEDKRDLRGDDAGAVVLDNDPEYIGAGFFDADVDVGKHLRFLAGVECVIDCFLYGGNDPPGRGVKSQQVFVLLEKLRDTDTALLLCEFLSEHHALSPRLSPRPGQASSARRSEDP